MAAPSGYPVVLTADRTLMAGYRLLLDGMLAASATTAAPSWIINSAMLPWPRAAGLRAPRAPLGLRRIEAALLAGGFTPEQVIVVDERHLAEAVGPETRLVALSSGEPAGQGMSSTTMTAVAGGVIYPQAMFLRLLEQVRRLRDDRAPQARILLGGPGAWQLAADETARRDLGVDHVICGYAEGNAASLFTRLLQGEDLPPVLEGEPPAAAGIPPLRGAAGMGVLEISRGCGLGCSFCTLAQVPMQHLPLETILADAETNLASGLPHLAALSEDFFRYGGTAARVNPPALLGLLARLRELPALRLLQTDHANLSSVARFSDEGLAEVRRLLVGDTGCRYPWLNLGVETASGDLLARSGNAAKLGGCPPADWGELCAAQLRRLVQAGFLPMVSLLVGLPEEEPEDLARTRAWLAALGDLPVTVFPVLYASLRGEPAPRLRRAHWELVRACYEINFRWVPRLYWDNQTAARVPLGHRLLIQALGRGQVLQWRRLFSAHIRRAPA